MQGLTFGQIKGPFQIPAGSYTINISLANTVAPCSNAAVIHPSVTVASGETAAVVAALSTTGSPTAYPFVADVSTVPQGSGRVTVAHAADAPAVDVTLRREWGDEQSRRGGQGNGQGPGGDKRIVIKNLMPGMEQTALVDPNTYAVRLRPAGTSTVVLGPVPLTVANRSVTLVFAVGSAASGSLTLLTQTIPDVF